MNALTAGVLLALLVAGYPLYELVTTGALDTQSALLRGALVAGACAAGVAAVVRLALGYETPGGSAEPEESEESRANRLNELYTEMAEAVAAGNLKDEAAQTPEPEAGKAPEQSPSPRTD